MPDRRAYQPDGRPVGHRPAPLLPTLVAMASSALALLAAPGPGAGQEPFRFHELAPGVVAAVVDGDVASYAFANSLIVIGEDGVLVVDTQQSPRPAAAVLREIRRRTDLPVRWVINTHWHADHVWGNQVYASAFPGVRFLSTPATRDSVRTGSRRQIEEQRAHTLESRSRLLSMRDTTADPGRVARIEAAIEVRNRYLADLDSLRIIPPEGSVGGRLRLDLGDREAVLIDVGPAHTPGDLIVHLPESGIAMVGDLIEEGELWLEGADIAGWVEALGRVLDLDADVLVPGHGAVQTDPRLLRAQRAELRALLEAEDAGAP